MTSHNTSLGHEEVAWESNVLPSQPETQKKYKCPQCPSSFKRPENLKRHQRGHDDNRRFTCQICDKSFARSDILGRHVAIHIPRERRDDNPHRRRACRECARVRERCSRGEPCRRCAIKALCCIYPEESQFKITMPHAWGSSISEPDDYDAAGTSSSGPDSTLGSPRDALSGGHGSSQWQVEGSAASFPEQFILSPSVSPHAGFYSYLASHNEAHFAPFFIYDALSFQDEGFCARSASDISTDDLKFLTGDAELDGASAVYTRATDIPSELISNSNQIDIYQPSPSIEFQGHYTNGSPLGDGHFNSPFDVCGSSSGTQAPVLSQPQVLDFSGNPTSQESLASVQVNSIGFDNQEPHFHSLQTPYSPMVDIESYDSITTTFTGSSQDKNQALQLEASTTAQRTSKHDFFLKLYLDHLKHGGDWNDGTSEVPGGFGT
ncbi:hypothetical protein F4859DRAFT_89413 [Xylaria cf. heliscus]|nr:hypothetical protein F4859DRAFT_89413 [Xylaria cf. heliscus]